AQGRQELVEQDAPLLALGIRAPIGRDAERYAVLQRKSRIDLAQSVEASKKQPGDDDHHRRERDLRNDERRTDALTRWRHRTSSSSPERERGLRSCRAQRGRDAERDADGDRDADRI